MPTDAPTTPPIVETPSAVGVDNEQIAADIAKYLQLWQSQNITSYRFTIERSCFCLEDARGPVVVEVNGDTVTITNAATGEAGGEFFNDVDSIDKLYALLEQQLNDGADQIDVRFDETTGVPQSIFVDVDFQAADEELRYTISNFEQTDGTTTQTAGPETETPTTETPTTETPVGQAPEPIVQTPEDIATRRQQWIDKNVTKYRYTIERSCFCAEDARGPVVVEVDGDTATVTNASTGAPGSEYFNDVNSITKIYDWLEKEANDGADEIAIAYDDATGVPLSIKVDKDFMMADEEMYYTLSNFEVVQ